MPAGQLLALLRSRGESLAFCESLTAGLAAATLAAVPGASHVLRGGLVTYATEVKAHFLGVSVEVLEAQGVVSAATAELMARAAVEHCGATWGVSLTGVAGPDRQEGKPPGTVFIGIAHRDGEVTVTRAVGLTGTRAAIRSGAVDQVWELLMSRLE